MSYWVKQVIFLILNSFLTEISSTILWEDKAVPHDIKIFKFKIP